MADVYPPLLVGETFTLTGGGMPGPQGLRGSGWHHVTSGPPPASLGEPEDYALDLTTGMVYVKDEDGWESLQTLKGPKGDKGEKGDKGDKGDAGAPGQKGVAGHTPYLHVVVDPQTPDTLIADEGDLCLQMPSGWLLRRTFVTWEFVANILGPEGPEGPKGDKGDTGDTVAAAGWTSYTPTIAGTGTTLGTTGSQISGKYMDLPGSLVLVEVDLTLGTGFTIGAGGVQVSPAPSRSINRLIFGQVDLIDTGSNAYKGHIYPASGNLSANRDTTGGYAPISATTPFTWAAGDLLRFRALYSTTSPTSAAIYKGDKGEKGDKGDPGVLSGAMEIPLSISTDGSSYMNIVNTAAPVDNNKRWRISGKTNGELDINSILTSGASSGGVSILRDGAGIRYGGASHFVGRGSGVFLPLMFAANVGDRYTDLDGTNGAIEWLATGPDTWKVVSGDTGWRRLTRPSHMVEPGSAKYYDVRRINDEIHVRMRFSPSGSQIGTPRGYLTITNAMVLPTGFVPESYGHWGTVSIGVYPLGTVNNNNTIGTLAIQTLNDYNPAATALFAAVDTITAHARFLTSEVWPSTLPGTAVAP